MNTFEVCATCLSPYEPTTVEDWDDNGKKHEVSTCCFADRAFVTTPFSTLEESLKFLEKVNELYDAFSQLYQFEPIDEALHLIREKLADEMSELNYIVTVEIAE